MAAIRFGLAAIFMLIWCRWEGTALTLAPRQLRTVLIAGTMLFAQIGLFNEGIARSNSSHASILINTFVFWVPAIEFIFVRHNRLSPAKLAGLLLAGSGGLIVVSTSNSVSSTAGLDQPSLLGDAFLLLSGFLLAIKIVYTQHALKSMEPGKFIFWHDVIGVAFFALWSGCFETFPVGLSALSLATWLGLLYQGLLVAGFCFAVQAWMLKRHPASQISVFSCSTPLFGVALGVLFRDDGLSEWLLLAAAAIAYTAAERCMRLCCASAAPAAPHRVSRGAVGAGWGPRPPPPTEQSALGGGDGSAGRERALRTKGDGPGGGARRGRSRPWRWANPAGRAPPANTDPDRSGPPAPRLAGDLSQGSGESPQGSRSPPQLWSLPCRRNTTHFDVAYQTCF